MSQWSLLLLVFLSQSAAAQNKDELIHLLTGDNSNGKRIWVAHNNPIIIDLSVGTECKSGEQQIYSQDGKLTIKSCKDGKVKNYETSWKISVENDHAIILIDNQEYLFNPYKDPQIPDNIYLELISISEISNRPFKYHQLVYSEL